MPLTWDEIEARALEFSKRHEDDAREEAEAQGFLLDFFSVFGVNAAEVGSFEYKVPVDFLQSGYIDYLWKQTIAVEMKSKGKDLDAAYGQLKEYVLHLPAEDAPKLLMVCDFENVDLRRPVSGERVLFKTRDLYKNVRRFAEVAGYERVNAAKAELELNVRAAEKMGKLYDALKTCGYDDAFVGIYLVRLLFCLFADDTGIFPRDSFLNYVENSQWDGSDLSSRLARVFEVMNMPEDVRTKRTLLSADLRQFRYVDGSLFKDPLPTADFDASMRAYLRDCCLFDWSGISPAIFGSLFQSVMDTAARRELGAHYTSEENILALIDPLFMDSLWDEFEQVKHDPNALRSFHDRVASLRFLDPACGCGNFLIIAYRELRRLETEIIKTLVGSQREFDIAPLLKVNVGQFYGIEIEDFPCRIAETGMWLMDHLMNIEVSELFGQYLVHFPLERGAKIVQANALRMDWEEVVPKAELNYIMGNPPFGGGRTMSAKQKADMLAVWGDVKSVGNLDYVTGWYRKAAEMMSGTRIRTAFVSTNSVSQGEQPAIMWGPLFERGVEIDFARRSFKWSNEAKGNAAVHCVIIGFSAAGGFPKPKAIYDGEAVTAARNINPYLVDAPNVLIESRTKPLCDVPEMSMGSKPIDNGKYLFTEDEMAEFIRVEPRSERWFRPWLGADEFINGYRRYCLWLGDCPPSELRKMPEVMKRVDAVRKFRLASKSAGTRKIADTPLRFHIENMPCTDYLLIPRISSEKRVYIPIGFISPEVMPSDATPIIPDATLYHFGVLTSSVHMAWTRAVCGRLEMRYRYSKDIVYNNFLWPDPNEKRRARIEKRAQGVLDARAAASSVFQQSLADLYDPLTMPQELLKAHRALDAEVMTAYGFGRHDDEAKIVAQLMEMYVANDAADAKRARA
ncbi:MAG: N-6 DNA methylase [Synergistaceae bacterium]|jgi:hypothetical protein|nr:N-6 DNA methylase [Synergistaceae bacterium]